MNMFFGRIIKGLVYNIFTPEALHLKEEVLAEVEEKKNKLESLIEAGTIILPWSISSRR